MSGQPNPVVYRDRRAASSLAAAGITALYRHTWPTPALWQAELQKYFPKNDQVSWLHLRWEPGDVWEPVQRWVIWHMRAPRLIANREDLLAELRGPHPRSQGHACFPGQCPCALKANRWVDGTVGLIDRATWELFQETGHYGTRWWVIQGNQGGHRYRLDAIERKIARIKTGKSDTPAPGDLPYADYDGRVLAKVLEADRLKLWKGLLDFTRRNHDQMDEEMRDLEQEANRLIWNWLDGQVDSAVEQIGRAGRHALADGSRRKVSVNDKDFDYEQIERDFIETPHIAA